MLASKALLTVTLGATFTSGMFVGLAAKARTPGAGVPPTSAAAIYAPQLAQFAAKGYDDGEMAEARLAYTEYLKGYESWWSAFLDTHRANTDALDDKLYKRLDALTARHEERTRTK